MVAQQVRKKGVLHIMVYHSDTQKVYEEEGRAIWSSMNYDEKIDYCSRMFFKYGGDLHGWWDALNPIFNWSWHEDEVKRWFQEEGFTSIKLVKKYNINMNGIHN